MQRHPALVSTQLVHWAHYQKLNVDQRRSLVAAWLVKDIQRHVREARKRYRTCFCVCRLWWKGRQLDTELARLSRCQSRDCSQSRRQGTSGMGDGSPTLSPDGSASSG